MRVLSTSRLLRRAWFCTRRLDSFTPPYRLRAKSGDPWVLRPGRPAGYQLLLSPAPPFGKVLLAALIARLVFGVGATLAVLIVGWLGPAFGLGAWAYLAPVSFEARAGGPMRRRAWRRWVENAWPGFADRAGLSHTESGTHRNRWNGTTSKVKIVSRPRLVNVAAEGERLDVTVGTRLGQTVADLEAAAPALADAAGAHSVRGVSEAPGMVRFEMVMRDLLSAPFAARPSTELATDAVPLGRREDGSRFTSAVGSQTVWTTPKTRTPRWCSRCWGTRQPP